MAGPPLGRLSRGVRPFPGRSGPGGARTQEENLFELGDQLAQTTDASEQKRIKGELARMTFGD